MNISRLVWLASNKTKRRDFFFLAILTIAIRRSAGLSDSYAAPWWGMEGQVGGAIELGSCENLP